LFIGGILEEPTAGCLEYTITLKGGQTLELGSQSIKYSSREWGSLGNIQVISAGYNSAILLTWASVTPGKKTFFR